MKPERENGWKFMQSIHMNTYGQINAVWAFQVRGK